MSVPAKAAAGPSAPGRDAEISRAASGREAAGRDARRNAHRARMARRIILQSAAEHATLDGWSKSDPIAFRKAKEAGLLDDPRVTGHMAPGRSPTTTTPGGWWTRDRIAASARAHESLADWSRKDKRGYGAALRHDLLDDPDITGHMPGIRDELKKRALLGALNAARRAGDLETWRRRSPKTFERAERYGLLAHPRVREALERETRPDPEIVALHAKAFKAQGALELLSDIRTARMADAIARASARSRRDDAPKARKPSSTDADAGASSPSRPASAAAPTIEASLEPGEARTAPKPHRSRTGRRRETAERQAVQASSRAFGSLASWKSGARATYDIARRRGWLGDPDLTGRMKPGNPDPGYRFGSEKEEREAVLASAREFHTRTEWKAGANALYELARARGWEEAPDVTAHMFPCRLGPKSNMEIRDREEVIQSARQYGTRKVWRDNERRLYERARRRGWLNDPEVTGHMAPLRPGGRRRSDAAREAPAPGGESFPSP